MLSPSPRNKRLVCGWVWEGMGKGEGRKAREERGAG